MKLSEAASDAPTAESYGAPMGPLRPLSRFVYRLNPPLEHCSSYFSGSLSRPLDEQTFCGCLGLREVALFDPVKRVPQKRLNHAAYPIFLRWCGARRAQRPKARS